MPDVSRETSERLDIFIGLLLAWNRKINLISRRDEAVLWSRHVADSLQLVKWMPQGIERAIDLGSGGGFPGLILALATKVHFTLVDSDARKCAFLREAVRATGANATVVTARIERAALPPAPLVTARALAPLPDLLAMSLPLLAPGGVMLFPKGASADPEIEAARQQWTLRIEQHISQSGGGGVILRISEVERA